MMFLVQNRSRSTQKPHNCQSNVWSHPKNDQYLSKNNFYLLSDDFLRYLAFLELSFFRQKNSKNQFWYFFGTFWNPVRRLWLFMC